MYYLDAGVLITAAISEDDAGETCRDLLSRVAKRELSCCTSLLTLDEVTWGVSKFRPLPFAASVSRNLLKLPVNFLEVNASIFSDSLDFVENHGLKPRDALHCASMKAKGVDSIISDDRDFDKVKSIKRISLNRIREAVP